MDSTPSKYEDTLAGRASGDNSVLLNDSVSSYLDLQSAMLENEKKKQLLQQMVEQQVKLRQLQERQKSLLEAQQHVSKLDYVTTYELQAKLDRLQSVKHRIATLQDIIDNAMAADSTVSAPTTSTLVERSTEGYDAVDSVPVEENEAHQNTSALVNDQLEHLYATVSNLLTDIDNMGVSGISSERPVNTELDVSAKSNDMLNASLDSSVSPLPYVNLIDKNSSSKSQRHTENIQQNTSSTGNASFVERHFFPVETADAQDTEVEADAHDTSISRKRVSELWKEMRHYQIQLEKLQERRKELTSYIQASQESRQSVSYRDKIADMVNAGNTDIKQKAAGSDDLMYDKPVKAASESTGIAMRDLLRRKMVKPNNMGVSTERTNATWGGSTSTSGDESCGDFASLLQSNQILNQAAEDSLKVSAPYTVSFEEAVQELWDALDYHNNILQILLDDQKALSVLLQNTLSVQKDSLVGTVLYGISPDFLIYQLDNCSAQIMVYRKQIVSLHKDLSELQKQFPEIDITYSYLQPTQRCYYVQPNDSNFDDSNLISPRGRHLRSRSSTPLKYAARNSNRSSEGFPQQNLSSSMQRNMYSATFSQVQNASPAYKLNAQSTSSHATRDDSSQRYEASASLTKKVFPVKTSHQVVLDKPAEVKHVATQVQKSYKVTPAKIEISDVDSNASGFPLFEALRDTIYSEAATLISQNEARPHFLIELFHELQQLNSDYLRQHCLFVIRDVVNGYIIETPKRGSNISKKSSPETIPGKTTKPQSSQKSKSTYTDLLSDMKPLYSENTPSESEADSESDSVQFGHPSTTPLQYDYVVDITSASDMTTPGSSQEQAAGDGSVQNPFEADFLGSTVIHLDEALQRVREIERLKQERDEIKNDLETKNVLMSEPQPVCDGQAQFDVHKLDAKIKQIMSKVIPEVKSGDDVCSEEKIKEICSLVLKLVSDERLDTPDGDKMLNERSDQQLQAVLIQCLNKFLGYHLSECGEELIVDISEVLFNELAYIYMADDFDDEDENKVDDAIIKSMVAEDSNTYEQESQSAASDLEEEGSVSSRSSIPSEKRDAEEADYIKEDTAISTVTANDGMNSSVVVDLSVSESKPLTSYGSGEDEDAGSGEEYDQYNESDDVPTSMQHDQSQPVESKETSSTEKATE